MRPARAGGLVGASLLALAAASAAFADPQADKQAIAARLYQWAAAFNARDAAGTCDLFAPDLVSTVPGAVYAGRDAVCARLAALLAQPGTHLHYSPDIQEIIVSGDTAVVRLIWTLTLNTGAARQTRQEAGMDVFQRQPDGRWSIVRFMAFDIDAVRDAAPSTPAVRSP